MMNASSKTVFSTLLASLTLVAQVGSAQAAKPAAYTPEVAALRADCAASYTSAPQAKAEANEYQFVYAKGSYKGEATGGKQLACTEGQYAAYLDTKADPSRVMSAYPTAAGRPTVKTGK